MSAVFTTTPTKPSLYPSTAPMYHFEPYVSPSSAAHQRHLSATTSTAAASPPLDGSRRRLRSAAPSISSNSHHRRVTGSLNPPAPSGRAASFDLTPVGSPTKHTPPSLSGYHKAGATDDGEDSVMRDPSPLRLSQQQQSRTVDSASNGGSSRVQYREPRVALAVSSSNDQLRFDEGCGDSSTEEGSRRGSLEDPAVVAAAFASSSTQAKSFQLRQRELSAQSSSGALEGQQHAGAQFSSSKSLGRAVAGTRERSNSRAKRPAASMMMGNDDDGMDSDDDAHGHPMPDFGGRMRLTSSRGADGGGESEDDGTEATPGRSALKPLSFASFSPAPVPSPRPEGRHQRALTEHDLNARPPARALPSSASHGSALSKPLADEDNIFLESPTARPRSTTSTAGGGLFSNTASLGRSRSLVGNNGATPARGSAYPAASGSSGASLGASAIANSKKAVSMDNLQVPTGGDGGGRAAEPSAPPSSFGSQGARTLARSRRTGVLSQSAKSGNGGGHRRGSSQDYTSPSAVNRPVGTTKSSSAQNLSVHSGGLSQSTSLTHLASSSSASHFATGKLKAEALVLNRSAPATYNRSPDELDALAFNDAKPLLAAFTAKQSLGKKFRPRDSGVSLGGDVVDSPMHGGQEGPMLPPSVPHRLPVPHFMPSRLSTTQLPTTGDEMDLQELLTPAGEPSAMSGWPSSIPSGGGPSMSASTSAFDFLGREAAEAMASAAALHHSTGSAGGPKPMPDTPVKTKSFGGGGLGKSLGVSSHPHPLSLATIRAEGSSSGSSSPSAAAAGSSALGLPPLGTNVGESASQHHSLNVLARSHRPSDVKPPHLKPASATTASPAPVRSLIPKRSMTFRPKPSSLQSRLTATSPESQTGSSSPPSGAESPTFLRRVAQHGGMIASPRSGALAALPRQSADGPRLSSLLRRTSSGVASMSGSESESGVEMTPTRRGPDSFARSNLVMTKDSSSPTHHRRDQELSIADLAGPSASPSSSHNAHSSAESSAPLQPRHSMPNLPPKLPSVSRRLHHRSSHPLPQVQPDEDLFEQRFKVIDALGQGAFSQVWKVQEREGGGDKVWAVKRTKGVFEGVKDRLRHLEEVDILRCLSTPTNPHVVEFVNAWEQNRQLFIQTELCELGNLAFFLEEYGRLVPRLDESRVWKIVRELSDGLHHIHSHDILHLDLKPANVLITADGQLKIGDFGLSTRYPRADPAEVLRNAGLGGEVPAGLADKGWEREGDRDYMAMETLSGNFGKPADIFSFGLLILEAATNIIVPTNDSPWHALRSDDFSDIDMSPLSPALIDLVTLCMRSVPLERPHIDDIVQHPVIVRARRGKPALVPEEDAFLIECLTGKIETVGEWLNEADVVVLEDVEMDG